MIFQNKMKWPNGRVIPILSLAMCSGLIGVGLYDAGFEARALPAMKKAFSAGVKATALRKVFVPPNDALPEGSRSRGAASRSPSCLKTNTSETQGAVAVLPESNYGKTVHERPVFLVYLSTIPEATHSFFFHIRDEQSEIVYGTFLPLEPETQILRVQLPEDAPRLEADTLYKWSIAIPCSGALEPDTPFVSGWIERVEGETLRDNPSSISEIEAVYQYGQAGIWYDMVALLDELNRRQPQDTETMIVWRETLQQIGIIEAVRLMPI